jgi:alpha-L-rhamnosidase
MLYAKTLEIAGKLYSKKELIEEAETIRQTIREQSFNGEFFVDNAERLQNGELKITKNTSEVCQYYAFYFNVATPESYPELWRKLSSEFGPRRQKNGLYPAVYPANSFIGNYLRLEILSRYNLKAQLLAESIDFFDYMARETGTLWENISPHASCNHGFASHVVHVLYRDILGIADVDTKKKVIRFQFSDLGLESCEGQMPLGDQLISLSWQRVENTLNYHYQVPPEYLLEIYNPSNFRLIEN